MSAKAIEVKHFEAQIYEAAGDPLPVPAKAGKSENTAAEAESK